MKVSAQILNLIPYKPGKPISETQREFGLTEIVKLASNENPLGPSPKAVEAVQKYLSQQHRYPDPVGYELVKKISEKWDVPASQIALGNGSNEIIDLLIRIFCEPSTDSILTSEAAFVAYQVCAQAARVKVRTVPLREDLTIDLKAIADHFFRNPTANIHLIFIPNPNNPTGTVVGGAELEEFLVRLGNRDDVLLVFDEAYTEYVRDPKFKAASSFYKKYSNVLVLKTFSKVYGMAGLRLGALVAPEYVLEYYNRVRNPFNVNDLAQVAGIAVLDDEDYVKASQKAVWDGLEYFYKELSRLNLKYYPSEANFVLFDTQRDVEQVNLNLLKKGVILRPVQNYGFKTLMRMTVGNMDENKKAIAAIEKMLTEVSEIG
ncbi:histidinol-phosphate transaminase [Pseudobdellovibrio exovorus]|uniref:Histidinol-phosphate aminotransferase n=1 Tax=Pseudobdellovibrio exovorus JSS TaxID=1184267 RepID=M4V782_9BACT|nr:histidinol-phosphate transaminase [Pseudobdellovibrio exovorus]AGH95053.1 histidinol-phosphate aminotransferase [Pseudobdellovibrio exovorus JSS]